MQRNLRVTNLLSIPSPNADDSLVALADWVELKALLADDGNASQEDLTRALEQAHSMDESEAKNLAGDVFKELLDRRDTCIPLVGKGRSREYPFTLNKTGTLLELRTTLGPKSQAGLLYLFLLLTSRADMDAQRKLDIGASLVQIYTGMLYRGPGFVGDLVRGVRSR